MTKPVLTGDIRLAITDGVGSIEVLKGDLLRDAGLETAILISLFSDRRATLEQVQGAGLSPADLKGWWGDATQSAKIGSQLWLLSRAKIENATNTDAEGYCLECLQWMVDDNAAESVEAVVTRMGLDALDIQIGITRPKKQGVVNFKYHFNWEAQSISRG